MRAGALARRLSICTREDGLLVIDDDRLVVATRGASPEEKMFSPALSAGSGHADWFRDELPRFVREVRDRAVRGSNQREARCSVALIDGAYRSAACGGASLRVTEAQPAGARPSAARS
jgi:hypothetical protein